MGCTIEFGGGDPNLCEPEPLTSKVTIAAMWKKEQIDLAELARLRWVEKWNIERIASHLGIGTTTLKLRLREIRGVDATAATSRQGVSHERSRRNIRSP